MFTLEQITTKDGLLLQGIVAEPQQSNGKAIVWIHGLTSTFYNNVAMINSLATYSREKSIAMTAFNTRGHDMITGIKKIDPQVPKGYTHVMGGAGYERFTDCVEDIDSMVNFLVGKGYYRIYLMGHSTGANKVCYYASVHDRKELAGVILAGPISDRLNPDEDQEQTANNIRVMEEKIEQEIGNELLIGLTFFPITAKRYVSLRAPLTLEDQFDYGDDKPKMTHYSQIKKRLLTVFAEKDEYADRPIEAIRKVFDEKAGSAQYQSIIIPDSLHSFGGKEEEVSKKIIEWIS